MPWGFQPPKGFVLPHYNPRAPPSVPTPKQLGCECQPDRPTACLLDGLPACHACLPAAAPYSLPAAPHHACCTPTAGPPPTPPPPHTHPPHTPPTPTPHTHHPLTHTHTTPNPPQPTSPPSTTAAAADTMPGEFEKHAACWMGWPTSGYLWREGAKPAQQQYAGIAKAISQFEPLKMIASPGVVSTGGGAVRGKGRGEGAPASTPARMPMCRRCLAACRLLLWYAPDLLPPTHPPPTPCLPALPPSCHLPQDADLARSFFTDAPNVEVVEIPIRDGWTRDWGPSVSHTAEGPTRGRGSRGSGAGQVAAAAEQDACWGLRCTPAGSATSVHPTSTHPPTHPPTPACPPAVCGQDRRRQPQRGWRALGLRRLRRHPEEGGCRLQLPVGWERGQTRRAALDHQDTAGCQLTALQPLLPHSQAPFPRPHPAAAGPAHLHARGGLGCGLRRECWAC